MKTFFKYWLPVIVWLGVIFIGSSDVMSAEQTSRIIVRFLRWLKPDISTETIGLIQFVIRKGAHVTEYAVLAMFLGRAVIHGTLSQMKMSILYGIVWVTATLVAVADEYHQSFVPSRDSSPWDVMIDSGGAIFGVLIASSWARRKTKT